MNEIFIQRLNKYLAERFPLSLTISSSLFGICGLYLLWLASNPQNVVKINYILPFCFFVFYIFTFILRLCDEIKDRDSEPELFPDRLLVKGEVLYEDIYKLLIGSLFFWIPFNYIFGKSPFIFTL